MPGRVELSTRCHPERSVTQSKTLPPPEAPAVSHRRAEVNSAMAAASRKGLRLRATPFAQDDNPLMMAVIPCSHFRLPPFLWTAAASHAQLTPGPPRAAPHEENPDHHVPDRRHGICPLVGVPQAGQLHRHGAHRARGDQPLWTAACGCALRWPPGPLSPITATIRWWMLLRVQNAGLALKRVAQFYMVGAFFNVFLLGSTGGDAVKLFYVLRGSDPRKRAGIILSVVMDRLAGPARAHHPGHGAHFPALPLADADARQAAQLVNGFSFPSCSAGSRRAGRGVHRHQFKARLVDRLPAGLPGPLRRSSNWPPPSRSTPALWPTFLGCIFHLLHRPQFVHLHVLLRRAGAARRGQTFSTWRWCSPSSTPSSRCPSACPAWACARDSSKRLLKRPLRRGRKPVCADLDHRVPVHGDLLWAGRRVGLPVLPLGGRGGARARRGSGGRRWKLPSCLPSKEQLHRPHGTADV